jgi:hypothetical protein
MTQAKDLVREALERLSEEEAVELLRYARHLEEQRDRSAIMKKLTQHPSISVPLSDRPSFRPFEPIQASGRPASEILIEDRR